MSDSGNLPATPTGDPSPDGVPPRSGCLTALMVMAGIVLLLPGLCAIVFTLTILNDPNLTAFLPALGVCFLIAFGGVMLLRAARRGWRR